MIKAPAEHEPVIPLQTNVVLLLMSAETINQPLRDSIAHRPELVAKVSGINVGDILSSAVIARLMTSEQGALKHIPEFPQPTFLSRMLLFPKKKLLANSLPWRFDHLD